MDQKLKSKLEALVGRTLTADECEAVGKVVAHKTQGKTFGAVDWSGVIS